MATDYKISASEVFAATSDLARRYAPIWLLAAGFMTVVQTGLDLALGEDASATAGNLVIAVLNFFVSYHTAEAILRGEGLLTVSARSYGSLFGASILTTLGIGLGFVLLFVPGLYLMARWSMVTPLIVGEGMSASMAMSESWERTGPSAWSLVVVYLVYAGAFVALLAVAGLYGAATMMTDGSAEAQDIGLSLVINLGASVLGMVGILCQYGNLSGILRQWHALRGCLRLNVVLVEPA